MTSSPDTPDANNDQLDPAAAPSGFVPTGNRIPGSVRKAVIERDGQICRICSRKVVVSSKRRRRTKSIDNQLTLDHIIPISKGGGPTVDNLRVTCRSCNMKRASGGMR